jgi:hypothetical protein
MVAHTCLLSCLEAPYTKAKFFIIEVALVIIFSQLEQISAVKLILEFLVIRC